MPSVMSSMPDRSLPCMACNTVDGNSKKKNDNNKKISFVLFTLFGINKVMAVNKKSE